jgi:agmatine deiminase
MDDPDPGPAPFARLPSSVVEESAQPIPAGDGYRMPPESAEHEATIMAWPCRIELWDDVMPAAKAEYAGVANAIAEFEPVIMVTSSSADATEARATLSGRVDIIELPLDDSWMRDSGPIFCIDSEGRRAGVHFRFNAWGGKYPGWDRDEQAGGVLAERYGDRAYRAPLVLEGGSVIIDSAGRAVTTEQCLLHPNRNPTLSKADIQSALEDYLGASEVVWLGQGLLEDRDTDGHVDLVAAFTDSGSLLLQARPPGDPNHDPMAENHQRAEEAGLNVIDFRPLARAEVAGHTIVHSYLNFYLCNHAVVVPLAGGANRDSDDEAVGLIGHAFPNREVIGVPGLTLAFGGGGPHCITQQIPARADRS